MLNSGGIKPPKPGAPSTLPAPVQETPATLEQPKVEDRQGKSTFEVKQQAEKIRHRRSRLSGVARLKAGRAKQIDFDAALTRLATELNASPAEVTKLAKAVAKAAQGYVRQPTRAPVTLANEAQLVAATAGGARLPADQLALVLVEPGTDRTVLVPVDNSGKAGRVVIIAEGELPEEPYERITERAFRIGVGLKLARAALAERLLDQAQERFNEAAGAFTEVERSLSPQQRHELKGTLEAMGLALQFENR